MSSEAGDGDVDGDVQAIGEFTVTAENTFEFIPGPLVGISCPNCFHDQLLKEVIHSGECTSCGTTLELTLRAGVGGD